jgi:uncharacterized membrane protein SpoIIM required for sporulation
VSTSPGPAGADGDAPAPLRTEPRSFLVHWLVDAAVVFLATIIVGLFLGVPWWAVLAVAGVVGSFGARVTHRADVRSMAERRVG